MTYEIKLPQFEGPFDLLLFFIERDELDIYDIPISKITRDFLDYIHQLEALNIEVASEFIVVAATLMRIKARMLLPRREIDEHGEEIDPRKELVDRLVEYKKYKTIASLLRDLETERSKRHERLAAAHEALSILKQTPTDAELHSLTLYRLMLAFRRAMERMEATNKPVKHTVRTYPYTINDEKRAITSMLKQKRTCSFDEVFLQCENRMHAIFRFLALLELLQWQKLGIHLREEFNNFTLYLIPDHEENGRG